jgi:hypothetical protein
MTATKRERMGVDDAIRHLTQRVCETVARGESTGRDFDKLARLRRRRDRQRAAKSDGAMARLTMDFAASRMSSYGRHLLPDLRPVAPVDDVEVLADRFDGRDYNDSEQWRP